MFDHEVAIRQWREKMSSSGTVSHETLEELENHLRDEIRALVLSGIADSNAFEMAVSQFGSPQSVTAEFRKTKQGFQPTRSSRLAAIWGIGLLAVGLLGAWRSGGTDFLLLGHVLSVTAGYCAALMGGAMGAYFVCRRLVEPLRSSHQHAMSRVLPVISLFAAGFVCCGFVLGMIWSGKHLGQCLGADAREVTGLCAGIWLASTWAIQRFGNLELRAAVPLSIAGSGMVGIAWFGAGALSRGYGISALSPLAVLLAIQALCFVASLLPIHRAVKA